MRKRAKLWVWISVGLIAVGCVCFALLREKEPEYQGQSISEWVGTYAAALQTNAAVEVRELAEDAIRRIGTNGIPYLLKAMWYEPPLWDAPLRKVQGVAPKWIAGSRVMKGLLFPTDKQTLRLDGAMMAFRILGSNGVPAVPELGRRVAAPGASESTKNAAFYALTLIGPVVIPLLRNGITNPAAAALWSKHSAAAAAWSNQDAGIIGFAGSNVRNTNTDIALASVELLGEFSPRNRLPSKMSGGSVDYLGGALWDRRPEVRTAALNSLGRYEAEARQYRARMIDLLSDPDLQVRVNAVRAIAPEELAKRDHKSN